MTPQLKAEIRRRISASAGHDIGEIFPEAFLDDARGAILHSTCNDKEFPHSNFAFVTRSGRIVGVRTSGLN